MNSERYVGDSKLHENCSSKDWDSANSNYAQAVEPVLANLTEDECLLWGQKLFWRKSNYLAQI